MALIWLTSFPVLLFQKEVVTLSLVCYLCPMPMRFPLTVPTQTEACRHQCMPTCSAGSGIHVFPLDSGEQASTERARINTPWTSTLPVIFNVQKKFWFLAWVIDKLQPLKVWIIVFFCPQQDKQMISFRAERSRDWIAAMPQLSWQQQYTFSLHAAAEVCVLGAGTHWVCTNSSSVKEEPQGKVLKSRNIVDLLVLTAQIHFCTADGFTFTGAISASPVI